MQVSPEYSLSQIDQMVYCMYTVGRIAEDMTWVAARGVDPMTLIESIVATTKRGGGLD